jgi:hypothetical protein
VSAASRKLKVGAMVQTDFSGKWTVHKVFKRREGPGSQSGVQFMLDPIVPKSSGGWMDADWFKIAARPSPPKEPT